MSIQLNDRVKETSATSGIIPIVLTGAPVGYQTVASSITSSNTFPYVVELVGGAEWEIGIGTYVSGNNSIIRTQILNSSNSGNIVNFSSGAKNVFVTIPAAYSALTARGLSQFSATTSAELASIISDETGSGKLVFSNNAILVAPNIGVANGTSLSLSGDLSVTGSVYLSGNVTTLSSNNLSINDPLIYMAQDNPANLYDIGIVGHFTSSSYQHTGLVRDASDGVWKLFSNVATEPTTTIDFTGAVYDTIQVGSITASNAVFSVANGSAPFSVASNTVVSNLNADLLDGQHGAYYTGLSSFAWDTANTAYSQANTGTILANSAYNQANSALALANAAFTKANSISTLVSTAIQTANYTASVNDLVRCNTAAGAFSVTFPASPIDGGIIAVSDIAGTFNSYNLTLLPNGKTIESDATGLILDMNGTYVSFVYSSSTSNWKLLETPLGGLAPTAIITSSYNASVNDIVRCNTAAGAFAITFPTSPSDGSLINVVDVAGTFYTNNLTINRGGTNTIEGDTSVILDINNAYTSFMYNTATANWRLLETPIGSLGNVTANTTVSGIVKISGTVLANAVAGVDYLAPPSGTALLKANNSGSLANATAGVDYVSANTSTTFTKPQTPSTSAETAPATNVVTWDLTTNQIFRINLNANITTFNLTGTLSNLIGTQYEVIIRYNGGSTVAWNTNMKWTAATAPTLTGTSGKIDVLTFVVASTDGTNYYLVNTGIKLNVG